MTDAPEHVDEMTVNGDAPSSASPAAAVLDSLSANEFAVELDGERMTGIFKVSGLVPFKLEVKPSLIRAVREPFKISKMVQRDPDNAFNRWMRDTIAAGEDIARPTRTVTVIAIDDGVETRRWTIKGAFIGEVGYSEFNSGTNELVEETLSIHYASVEIAWFGQ